MEYNFDCIAQMMWYNGGYLKIYDGFYSEHNGEVQKICDFNGKSSKALLFKKVLVVGDYLRSIGLSHKDVVNYVLMEFPVQVGDGRTQVHMSFYDDLKDIPCVEPIVATFKKCPFKRCKLAY